MATQRSVDPRFDPRFQRGYDHSSAPATAPATVQPVQVPIEATEAARPPSRSGSARVDPDVAAAPTDEVTEPLDDDAQPPRRNPFRLALLLTSLGLIVLAVGTMWWIATHPGQYLFGSAVETAGGWMVQQLSVVVPPSALVAGLVGVGAWLGLGALESLERTADAHPEPADDDA